MQKEKKRKRINLSIKRDMQIRLFCKIFIFIMTAVIISGVIFWLGSHREVASTYRQFHVQLDNFKDLIFPMVLTGMGAGLVVALVLTLFFPQYLVGPLYRIEKILDMAADGDLSECQLNLRSGDEMKDLAGQVIKMMKKMRERVLLLKEDNKQMEAIYNRLVKAVRNSNRDMIIGGMSDLEKEITKIKESLDEFKV
ncbi:MAG: methyl-accepting chemotaxis protein [Deltaproteobacteria bacterium]|nr:methyl-accepting chemotaxis protein [Deltaproteobacteria bacterium]